MNRKKLGKDHHRTKTTAFRIVDAMPLLFVEFIGLTIV